MMDKDMWYSIMNDYLKSYEAIHQLLDKGILNEDDAPMLFEKLLEDIIVTFKSEVEE